MKKIICLMLLGMFFISFASAMDWDNKVTYSEDKLNVNVKNLFGFGVDYGDIKLTSHKDLNKPIYTNSGDHVLIQEITGKEDYNNFIGVPIFENLRKGRYEELEYYWQKAIYGEIEITDYKKVCDTINAINGSSYEKCRNIISGTHIENKIIGWKNISNYDIKKGEKITLGLIVDYIPPMSIYDVKPYFFGKKIEEWAEFTNIVVDAHSYALANQETGQTEFKGFTIEANDDKTLINVTKKTQVTATHCYIYSQATGNHIANVSFSGDNADFSDLYINLSSGSQYYVMVGSEGGSFTNYRDTGSSFPEADTNIDWINGATYDSSAHVHSGISQAITQITTGDLETSSLTIDIVNLDSYINSTTFDLEYTFTNITNCDSIWYSLDEGDTNSSRVDCGTNFTDVSGSEGILYPYVCGNLTDGTIACDNQTLTIDTTPPHLEITSITNGQTNLTEYTTLSSTNITLNWITTDTNLANCSFFNITSGANESITCGTNATFYAPFGNYSFYVYGTDEANNKNSTSVNALFDYRVLENNVTYEDSIVEGSPGNFEIDFNVSEFAGLSVSYVKLIYDNVTYNSTIASVDGNNIAATNTITIPSVSENLDKQFYYNIILSDASSYNSSVFNQSIINLGFDDCSSLSDVLYSFFLVDEEHQTNLTADVNTTIEVSLTILDSKRTSILANFSNAYNDINPANICLNASLIGSSAIPSDLIVRYYGNDYAKEYYNVYNYSISNSTLYQNITLYDLNGTDSTEFKIVLQDTDYTPISGALIMIDRQYIAENNTFKTIEVPITDTNGQTLGHFVKNDIVYNIRAVKDGVVVSTLNNVIAFCEDLQLGNCIITLNPSNENTTLFEYFSNGITFTSPTFSDATNKVSFSFVSTDGGEKNVQMLVTKNDIYGNRSVCSDSVDSISGTLECSIPGDFTDAIVNVEIKSNGNTTAIRSINVDSFTYGNIGYVLWFVLTFISIIFFLESKTAVLISLSLSYIGAVSLAIIKGSIVGLGSAGVWILLITIVGVWKLNRGRQQ